MNQGERRNPDDLTQAERDAIHELILRESIPYWTAAEIIRKNKPRPETHTDAVDATCLALQGEAARETLRPAPFDGPLTRRIRGRMWRYAGLGPTGETFLFESWN